MTKALCVAGQDRRGAFQVRSEQAPQSTSVHLDSARMGSARCLVVTLLSSGMHGPKIKTLSGYVLAGFFFFFLHSNNSVTKLNFLNCE